MDIELKDLKLEKVRNEIEWKDGNSIKVFNATGEQRDNLLKELLSAVDLYEDKEFYEYWYKYLIKNFTNIKVGRIKIRTLLENPTVEFLKLKRSLDEMVNEVYLDMLLAQINNLEEQNIQAHINMLYSK